MEGGQTEGGGQKGAAKSGCAPLSWCMCVGEYGIILLMDLTHLIPSHEPLSYVTVVQLPNYEACARAGRVTWLVFLLKQSGFVCCSGAVSHTVRSSLAMQCCAGRALDYQSIMCSHIFILLGSFLTSNPTVPDQIFDIYVGNHQFWEYFFYWNTNHQRVLRPVHTCRGQPLANPVLKHLRVSVKSLKQSEWKRRALTRDWSKWMMTFRSAGRSLQSMVVVLAVRSSCEE